MKGGTMSMRHGDHLGDLDDNDDDDDDGLEAGLKDSAKKSRENVRKPLRNMVKTAAKRLNKESYDLYDIILSHLINEGYDLSDYTQLDEISDKLATAARNLRQKKYTKSADQARNLQLSKGNRADTFYKNFDKTVKLNDTLKSREKRTGTKIPRVEQLDLYDVILSHLIDEGYADTQEAAERIMVNMSEEWRESIVETRMDPRGRPASGPMNVYANPKGKPSQAHLDAVKSYEDEQKKKTPEQRKKELDDYRERQMNNK